MICYRCGKRAFRLVDFTGTWVPECKGPVFLCNECWEESEENDQKDYEYQHDIARSIR